MDTLDTDALQAAASGLGWEVKDGRLTKVVERGDFAHAMQVVNAIAQLAEAANHHPDICIHWNKVELVLWTHSAGGVTQADVDLAGAIEGLLA